MSYDDLEQAFASDLDVSAYAETVHTSDASEKLEGRTLSNIMQTTSAFVTDHMPLGHDTTANDVDTFVASDVQLKVDSKLGEENVPMTRVGTMDYLQPNITGGQQGTNMAPLAAAPTLIEPNGTIVSAIPMTNGELVANFLTYWEGGQQASADRLGVGTPVITNEFLKLGPDYDLVYCLSSNDKGFFAIGRSVQDLTLSFFFVLTNGSFKDGTYTVYNVVRPEEGPFGALPLTSFSAIDNAIRITSYVYESGSETKFILTYRSYGDMSGAMHPQTVYTGIIPPSNTTPITMQMQSFTSTKGNGEVVTGPEIRPYRSMVSTAAENSMETASEYDSSVLSLVSTRTFQSSYFLQDPEDENRFLLVLTSCLQLAPLTTLIYEIMYFHTAILIDFNEMTTKLANTNRPLYTLENGVLNARGVVGDKLFNSYFWPHIHGTCVFESNNILYSMMPPVNSTAYRIRSHPPQQGYGSWFEVIRRGDLIDIEYSAGSTTVTGAGSGNIANALRTMMHITPEFAIVACAGDDDSGNRRGSESVVVTRTDDGVRPVTAFSFDLQKNVQVPMPMLPRSRKTWDLDKRVNVGMLAVVREHGQDVRTKVFQFCDTAPAATYDDVSIDTETAELNVVGERTVVNPDVYVSMRQQLESVIAARTPNAMFTCFELLVPSMAVPGLPTMYVMHLVTEDRRLFIMVGTATVTVSAPVSGLKSINNDIVVDAPVLNFQYATNMSNDAPIVQPNSILYHGSTILHEYEHNGQKLWMLGLTCKTAMRTTGGSTTYRGVFALNANNKWDFVRGSGSHTTSASYTLYSDKHKGICACFGDRTNKADFGSKLIVTPYFVDGAAALARQHTERYAQDSFSVFSVKPPVSFNLHLPEAMPVLLNGSNTVIPATPIHIHDVCETQTLISGRYYLYVVNTITGDLEIVTNTGLIPDTATRTLLGHVEFDALGITALFLHKVTKIGSYRLTAESYYGQAETSIAYSSGHPSVAATAVTNNVI